MKVKGLNQDYRAFKCVSVQNIINAVVWLRETTFVRFYFRDLNATV